MPDTNRQTVPLVGREIKGVPGFASGIFRAAQNWHDNEYVDLPGFRDRIVQVRFNLGEGGLNLNMPPKLITTLANRGERAGDELVARFVRGENGHGGATELTWNNHRRIRLRVGLAALEEFVVEAAAGYTGEDTVAIAPRRYNAYTARDGEKTYEAIAEAPISAGDVYGAFDGAQRSLALRVLALLIPEAIGWSHARGRDLAPNQTPSLLSESPQPPQKLRIGPLL